MTSSSITAKAEAEYDALSDLERERILRRIAGEHKLTEVIPFTKYSRVRFADFREEFQGWIAGVLENPTERAKIPSLRQQRSLFDNSE
jgi:hypothetical protein